MRKGPRHKAGNPKNEDYPNMAYHTSLDAYFDAHFI